MPRFVRLAGALAAAAACLVVPASADQAAQTLLPGVTFTQQTELTPHGPVSISVVTMPAPTGLYSLGPVLAGNTISAPRAPLTAIEKSVSGATAVVGVNGDFFNASNGQPNGLVVQGGAIERMPVVARSSIGFDATGKMLVTRLGFNATWQGSGQRRPIATINQKPGSNQVVLFTPAWGAQTPVVPASGAAVVIEPFPAATFNTDVTGPVTAVADPGAIPIPADGAVLVATGASAAKLQAEAPQGQSVTVRITMPTAWSNVVTGLGGGPSLVKNGKAVFHTSENFDATALTNRDARSAVGQLSDGRVILVTVDGGRPGHSIGMTTYELAQEMAKLGAVTAAGLQYGPYVTTAANGELLNRPSAGAAKPVKEGLLLQYSGVIAGAPSQPVLTKPTSSGESLAYTIVRPSNVTATVVDPAGNAHQVDTGMKQPGTYRFAYTAVDTEDVWHWNVQATDDLGRQSAASQTFTYDLTLSGLRVVGGTGAKVSFTLSRPASVSVRIEATNGTTVDNVPATQLAAGAQSLTWDGNASTGAIAPAGGYIAEVTETSSVGTAVFSTPFTVRG